MDTFEEQRQKILAEKEAKEKALVDKVVEEVLKRLSEVPAPSETKVRRGRPPKSEETL